MRLLLFDIDGTLLLRATEAHSAALYAALREVYGVADPSAAAGIDPSGRTDGEIARLLLLGHGVSSARIDERLDDLREAACRLYAELCPDDLSATVAPGVGALLAELAERDDVVLALLTGNYEPIARLKLARAGIGHFFASGQGAFGSDGEDRAGLPAIARRRAGRAGAPHPREHTLVIGDTPRDIACARADGVGCLAVATGRFAAADLAGADGVAANADELAPLLEDWLAAAEI